jgi:diguanylate cyclase (GGDEF)-like protein/PAS domain S-box-containing protein
MEQIRKRISRLEESEKQLNLDKKTLLVKINELQDQVKKLKCLYSLSALSVEKNLSVQDIMQESVEHIPRAMQYPESYCARIIIDDQEFRTQNYSEAELRQKESICAGSNIIGTVEVCCLNEKTDGRESPFESEDVSFIKIIANHLGEIIDCKHSDAVQLFIYHQHLRAEEALRESEQKYSTVVEKAGDGIVIIQDEAYQFANRAMSTITGYEIEEIIGKPFGELFSDNQKGIISQLNGFATSTSDGPHVYESIIRQKNGCLRNVEISFAVIKYNRRSARMGFFRDITERKKAEATIRQLAYHDALTGLPNRTHFSEKFESARARARRNEKRMSVILMDLDRFKEINDTLGHKVGDLLLQAAAERLISLVREEDVVARMGGDEFMLLLSEVGDVTVATGVAEKIVEAFRAPFVCDGHKLAVTSSVGVAIYPEDGMDIDMLMKNADIALYRVKEAERNSYRLYSETV